MFKKAVSIAASIALAVGAIMVIGAPAQAARPQSVEVEYVVGTYVDSTNTFTITNEAAGTRTFEWSHMAPGSEAYSYVTLSRGFVTLAAGESATIDVERRADSHLDVFSEGGILGIPTLFSFGFPSPYDKVAGERNLYVDIRTGETVKVNGKL